MSHVDASEVVAAALDDLKRACVTVEDALTADDDLDRAFAAASRWTDGLRRYTNSSADVRSRLAVRIRDKEGLSLSALADRWGMSKARAAQLVKPSKETGGSDGQPSG